LGYFFLDVFARSVRMHASEALMIFKVS